ncbi:MAG: zinc ribbon domain-containing protein [Terriglobales bacterium]
MAPTASNVHGHGEFWRPPLLTRQEAIPAVQTESCARCGTEYALGSRFCHVCGSERAPQAAAHRLQWPRFLSIPRLQERLGLSLASVIALSVGILSTLAAIGTGLVYTAATLLDWQAVQIWRIEWLLAAIAAFLAGILLKAAGGPKPE